MNVAIRPENAEDRQAIRNVNRAAFGCDAEANLVEALREGGFVVVSLVADLDGEIVGHILFSQVSILTENRAVDVASLAPMAVLPGHQRQGIGSSLVEEGLHVCREYGETVAVVLGHASFYPRFGFSADLARSLKSPFGGDDVWMAMELVPGALNDVAGSVQYPPPFGALE